MLQRPTDIMQNSPKAGAALCRVTEQCGWKPQRREAQINVGLRCRNIHCCVANEFPMLKRHTMLIASSGISVGEFTGYGRSGKAP
jgi:hypothetical protein